VNTLSRFYKLRCPHRQPPDVSIDGSAPEGEKHPTDDIWEVTVQE
jgi:hypothetical protein